MRRREIRCSRSPEYAGRYRVRQDIAKPLLEQFHAWLKKIEPRVVPKSLLGEAVSYALNQWPALQTYLEDGPLEIDNNATERDIRLFVRPQGVAVLSNPQGCSTSAVLFSIVRSAKANGLEPYCYLRELFEKLPAISPQDTDAIEALLPWRVAERTADAVQQENSSAVPA